MRGVHLAALMLLAPLLGGCFQTAGVGSVAGGECRIFERPPYVVLGKARYDQNWIDSQIEGGVGGCHWRRPQARPAELDAGRTVAAAPKKRGLMRRIRDRVGGQVKAAWPATPTAPIAPVPAPVVATPEPAPPPVAKPRSAIDELLSPESPNDRVRRVFP